jgi:hypothetical protein
MKRILFVLLMMTCSISWAEWTFSSASNDGEETYYYNKSTIKRNGVIARMWALQELSSEQINGYGAGFRSRVFLTMYNCKEEMHRVATIVNYSRSMGKGRVVSSDDYDETESPWRVIVPGSVTYSDFKIACSKQ